MFICHIVFNLMIIVLLVRVFQSDSGKVAIKGRSGPELFTHLCSMVLFDSMTPSHVSNDLVPYKLGYFGIDQPISLLLYPAIA